MNNNENGELFNKLNEIQKEELLKAYEESFEPANLISHEDVKQSKEWLFAGKAELEHNIDQVNIRDIAYE